jgi:hypothetical protein
MEEARVVWTGAEQAIVDYLAAEPGPARSPDGKIFELVCDPGHR